MSPSIWFHQGMQAERLELGTQQLSLRLMMASLMSVIVGPSVTKIKPES